MGKEQVQAMTDIQIPREAVEEALRAFGCECGSCRKAVLRVLRAGLKAWPNAWINCDLEKFRQPATHLILPLPQEGGDE